MQANAKIPRIGDVGCVAREASGRCGIMGVMVNKVRSPSVWETAPSEAETKTGRDQAEICEGFLRSIFAASGEQR